MRIMPVTYIEGNISCPRDLQIARVSVAESEDSATTTALKEVPVPVIKNDSIKATPVVADSVKNVIKADVVGPAEGWPDHTMRLFRMAPGGHTPHHSHDWEHVNFIVKGKGKLTIDGVQHTVETGDYAYVPPNAKHQFENPFDDDFEFLCIVPQSGA